MAAPIGPVRLYRSKYGRPTAPPVAPPSTSPAPVRYYKPKYASPLAPRVPPPPSLPQTPEEALASRTWGETAVDTGIRAARQAGGLAQAGLSIFGAPEELAAPEPVGTSPGEILASGARSGLETASGIGIPRIARAANAALGSGLDALGEYASPGRRRADELFAQIDAEEKAALPATEASAPVPASSGRWGAHQGEGYDPAAVSRAAQRAEQEAKLTFRKIGADPAGMVGDIAGNALPFMAAGRLGRVAGISEEAMAPLFSVPLEAGSVKQNIAQTVMDEPHENLMSDPKYAAEVEVFGKEVARKRLADRAQSYLENPGLIALGAAEGYILSKLGADAALMRAGSGAVKRGVTGGVLKNTLVQGAKETATEIPQEMFTTAAGNIGAASGGANIDPMRGVVESGIMAGATAGPAGAAAGGVDAFKAARERSGEGQVSPAGEQDLAEDEFTQTVAPPGPEPPRTGAEPVQSRGDEPFGAPIAPVRRPAPAFDQTAAQIVLEAEILGGDGLKALMDTGMSKARAESELKRVRAVLGPKAPPAKGVDRAEDKKSAQRRAQAEAEAQPSPADEIASFDADPLANAPKRREGTPEELAAYLEDAQRGISTAEDEATLAGRLERARSEAQANLENQAYAGLLDQRPAPAGEDVTAARSEAQRNLEEQWVRERADQLAVAEAGGPAFYVPKLIAKAVAQDSIKPLADAGYPASPSQLRKMLERAKASAASESEPATRPADERTLPNEAQGEIPGIGGPSVLGQLGEVPQEAQAVAERVNPVVRTEENLPAAEAIPRIDRPARAVTEDAGNRGEVHAESVPPNVPGSISSRGTLLLNGLAASSSAASQQESERSERLGRGENDRSRDGGRDGISDKATSPEEVSNNPRGASQPSRIRTGTVADESYPAGDTPSRRTEQSSSSERDLQVDGLSDIAASTRSDAPGSSGATGISDSGSPVGNRSVSQKQFTPEPEPKEPNLTDLDYETRALYDEIAARIEQIQSAEPNATHAIIAQRVNKEFGTDSRLGRGREALSRRIVDEILTGRGPRRAVPGTKKEDVPVRMAQSVNLEKDFDATMDRIEGEAARRSETGIAFDAAERMLRERFGPLEAEPDPEADLAAQLEESVRNTRGKGIQGKPAVAVSDQAGISEIPSALGGAEDRSGPVSEEGGGDARDVSEPARGTRDLVADEAPKTVEAHAESVPPKTKETKYEFSSTQVDMPPPLAADIKAVAAGIADEDLAGDGREVDPHATVKFGLHTNDEAEVRKVLEGEGPIKVTFGEISTFPPSKSSDGAAVVKIDLDSPDLHRLNKKIAGALEVTDTFPTYKPHVTLAYVKPESAAAYVGRPHALSGRTITLDSVTFSAKDGREIVIPLTGKPQEAETVPVERPKPEPKGDFEGFTASMTPLQKGQARAALAKDGRAGKIEAAVAAGSSVRVSKLADMPESKRLRAELERLQKPSRPLDSNDDSRIKEIRSALDGIGPQKNVRTLPLTLGSARIYTDEALGKTALDYAEFLIAKRDGKAEPTATGPEVKATRGRALVNEKAREQTKANLERLMTGRGRLYVGPQSRVMVDGKEVLVPTASIMKELGATMDPKDFNYWIPAKAANAATEAAEVTQVEAKPTSPEKAAAKVEAQIERVVDMKGAKSAKEVHDRILKALEAELVAAEKDSPFKEITYRPGGTANGKPAGTVLVDGEAVATVHSGELKWNESRGEAERRIGVDKHDAFGRNETQTTVAPVARLAIARELSKDAGSIKLQIPGDGTFTISRNPEAIRATIDRIKKGGAAPWKSVASYKAEAKADAKKQGPLFSRKPSAEEPRDLILQHNLTAANLIHADKMGGLAVPSMAVGKVDMPLEGFGEITLLGNKSMADPSESGMQVFSGDIYSPRYPTIRYKIRKASVIDEALKESNKAIGYSDWQDEAKKGGIDALSSSNPNVVWTFLRSKGIEPDVRLAGPSPERMAELRKVPGLEAFFGKPTYQNQEDPEFRRLALEELKARHSGLDEEERRIIRYEKLTDDQKRNVTRHLAYELEDAGTNKVDRGKSRDSLRDQLQALGLEREFETFRRDLFERAGSDSKIFKGFTNAGNERTIPHTLENVVAEMKRNMKAGEGFSYGPGTVRGAVAPRLKSLQEIRNAKDRIVSKEAMAAVKEEVNTTFWEAAGHLPTGEGFGAGDRAVNFMVDVSRMGFPRAEREYGWKLSEADRKAVGDFMTMLQTVPTEYFEAKLQRAVGIGEFSAAVVPNDADPKAVAILESHGIKIERYDRSDPADRKRAISDATEGEGMRFSRRPGESAPFFSQLERAAETVKQPMKGSDMLRFLSTREGVKASELKWTGLDDFLRKKGEARVTPEEVREFLKANKVTVTEVTRGEKGTLDEIEAAKRKYQQLSDLTEKLGNDEVFDRASIDEFHRVRDSRDEARRQYERLRGEGTNFSQYQLPGGSNYREVLLTLPGSGENERLAQRWFKKTFTSLSVSERQFVEREAKTDPPRGEFRSSHFDEPNILAHVRFNERTSADGKRVLFLEEIQSDWAQKGRKEGFKGENQAKAAERDALLKKETLTEAEQARLRAVRLEIDNDRTTKPNAVPAAPFVEKTEDWTALAMKAILQKAATEGYDSVAWTTGDMQAERYDLSKQLTHVTIVPNEPGGKEFVWWTETNAGRQMGSLRTASDGTILKAHSDYGDVVGKNVSDVFGKDLAEKGLSVTKETRLSGLDLKVGGEGMKAFYDRIVPQVAEKIGKKWGAKIGMIQIPGGRMKAGNDPFTHSFLTKVEAPKGQQYFIVNDKTGEQLGPYATSAERQAAMDALEGPRVHSIPITPEMRASVTSEGFPLFQRAGETTEADWEHYNGRQDADRAESSKTAYRDGVQVNGAAPGVRVVDFEGDVDKSVLNEMARSSASLAARIAPAVRMIQAHVPDLKFGGFAPAGNLHGVQVSGMVFVNQLATHQIAVAMAAEQGITYHEAFAKALTYVLVHEAAHYAERGHGAPFQAELDRIMAALGPVALKAIRRDFMKYASDNKNRAQNARMYEKALPGWREGERRGREAAARATGDVRARPDIASGLYPRPRSDTSDPGSSDGKRSRPERGVSPSYGDAAEGMAAPAFVRGADGRVAFARKPAAPPEKLSVTSEGILSDLAKRLRDVFTPVKVAQEAVEKKIGKRWNVRLDRQLTGIPARADHTMGQAESLFLNPLMEVVRTKGLDFDLAGEYAQAVYDEGMDEEKRASIMEKVKGKRADYEEVRKRILDVQRVADDYKVKMGLLTAEEVADIRDERGDGYVSTREHPLIAAIQDLEKTVIQAERNRTLNDLAEFVEAVDEPKLGTVSEGFEEGGVHFRRDGEPMTIDLPDKGLRAAMDGLSDTQLDNLTQTVGALTRWTSRVNTQLSPVFPIRNTGRDWGGAILFGSILHGAPKGISKSVAWEVMKNEFKAMRGVIDYLKAPEKKHPEGSWAAKVAEASRYGAVPGYLKQMSSIGKIRSQLEESLKSKLSAREHLKVNVAEARTALGDRSLDSLGKTAKIASLGADAVSRAAGFRAFSDFMGWLSNVSEMATRANYHTALVKNGMNPRVAADETRDLIDFNRKGSWTRNMQAFLPFINPNIQGTARILDMVTSKDPAVKARALKTITALTAAGFAYGMAMAALGGDEDKDGIPDMDQLPDYQSSRNVILPAVGNLSPILLPLPPGFNVPFFAGFMASKLARGTVDPGKAIASIAAQFAEAFTPVDSPFGVFKPLSEIATNKKFGGGPVSPTNYSEHRPDSTLAFKNTRTPYRVAAEGLNRLTGGDEVTKGAIDVSPDTLEHLGEALLGGTGRFFTRSADSVEALAKGQVPNYIPVYSDLTVDVERHRQARFYDQVRQIEEIDFKRRGKEKSALVKELAERYPGVDFTRGTLPQLRKALQGQGVSPERREWFLKEMERIDGAALRAKPLFDDAEKALKNIEKTMKDGPEKDAARREVYLRANRAYQEALK